LDQRPGDDVDGEALGRRHPGGGETRTIRNDQGARGWDMDWRLLNCSATVLGFGTYLQ
jgi:hypothetical protein